MEGFALVMSAVAVVVSYQMGYHSGYSDSEWKWILWGLERKLKK